MIAFYFSSIVKPPFLHLPLFFSFSAQIFTVLVDFLDEVLMKTNTNSTAQPFLRWIPVATRRLVFLASEKPMVSGFYRLLAVCMRLSKKFRKCSEINKIKNFCLLFPILSLIFLSHG
jgi:hypothetical protein